MSRKVLSPSYKKMIADLYNFKCQNKPSSNYFLLKGNLIFKNKQGNKLIFEDFYCPLYINGNGSFNNINTYEIDHKIDLRFGGINHISNYFPLCKICHNMKTRRGHILQNHISYNEHCPFNSNPCKKNRNDCDCNMNK